jgi:hypothetical protein
MEKGQRGWGSWQFSLSGFVRSENIGNPPTLYEYGSGGKSSTWSSGEAFEEDIDGDQDAVFLAYEVSGMDVVHADSGGDVLEDGGDR